METGKRLSLSVTPNPVQTPRSPGMTFNCLRKPRQASSQRSSSSLSRLTPSGTAPPMQQEVVQFAWVTGEIVCLIAVLGIPDVGVFPVPPGLNQGVSPSRIEGPGGKGGLEMSMVVAYLGIDGIS